MWQNPLALNLINSNASGNTAQDYLVQAQNMQALSPMDQIRARENAEEQYLAYIFVQNSAAKHDTLHRKLSNDYTKGGDQYPQNRSTALMFLDKYTTNQWRYCVCTEGQERQEG